MQQLTQGVCPALRKGLCAVVCGVFWASVVVGYLAVLCASPCAWFPAAVQHSVPVPPVHLTVWLPRRMDWPQYSDVCWRRCRVCWCASACAHNLLFLR